MTARICPLLDGTGAIVGAMTLLFGSASIFPSMGSGTSTVPAVPCLHVFFPVLQSAMMLPGQHEANPSHDEGMTHGLLHPFPRGRQVNWENVSKPCEGRNKEEENERIFREHKVV